MERCFQDAPMADPSAEHLLCTNLLEAITNRVRYTLFYRRAPTCQRERMSPTLFNAAALQNTAASLPETVMMYVRSLSLSVGEWWTRRPVVPGGV